LSPDECFQKYFALDDSLLKSYSGQWDDQFFAQLALTEDKLRCVEADNDRFRKLRDSITAFQALPEIQEQAPTNPTSRKQ
jgi:hypothetical protein